MFLEITVNEDSKLKLIIFTHISETCSGKEVIKLLLWFLGFLGFLSFLSFLWFCLGFDEMSFDRLFHRWFESQASFPSGWLAIFIGLLLVLASVSFDRLFNFENFHIFIMLLFYFFLELALVSDDIMEFRSFLCSWFLGHGLN